MQKIWGFNTYWMSFMSVDSQPNISYQLHCSTSNDWMNVHWIFFAWTPVIAWTNSAEKSCCKKLREYFGPFSYECAIWRPFTEVDNQTYFEWKCKNGIAEIRPEGKPGSWHNMNYYLEHTTFSLYNLGIQIIVHKEADHSKGIIFTACQDGVGNINFFFKRVAISNMGVKVFIYAHVFFPNVTEFGCFRSSLVSN